MNKIIFKEQLSEKVFHIKVTAPLIAKNRHPGQFIILMLNENLAERIPLTIADANKEEGYVSLIFQVVGATTFKLSKLNVGDSVNLVGPLGTPTKIQDYGNVVCIAGGVGIAPLFPISKALKEKGNKVTVILGARNKDLIFWQDRFKEFADDVIICTDDGSLGKKALVTNVLEEICLGNEKPDLTISIGPLIMMKFCALTSKKYDVKSIVSLNTIMIDGTGMCGGCRVKIGNEIKFVCVDGPEFEAENIDFDNLLLRQGTFKDFELEESHKCKLF